MKSGKIDPESVTDQRCSHCKLFYSSQGITTHEPNCPLQDMDAEVVATGAVDDVDDEPRGPSQEEESHDDETQTLGEEHVDGVDAGSQPEPDSSAGVSESTSSVATDGGTVGLDLEGPPSTSADVDVAPDDDPSDETEDCPNCGEDAGMTADEFRDDAKYRCEGCGGALTWRTA